MFDGPSVAERDRGSIGGVPTVLAPLLEEVGIATRVAQNLGDGVGFEDHALLGCGNDQGIARVVVIKAIDGREFEESLSRSLLSASPVSGSTSIKSSV